MIQIPNICEFPLIVKRGDLTIARVPTEADKEGAIHFAATVKEGDEVRFSYGAQLRIFSEIYYCNGEGGELNSALVAVGIREGEAEKIEVELDKDILREERVKNDLLIPLEYRVMNFMNAVTGDLEEMTKRAK